VKVPKAGIEDRGERVCEPGTQERKRGRAAGLVIAALGVAVLAGCGSSDRAADATRSVERFEAALERRDGEAACAELARETADKLRQQEQESCPRAILTVELPRDARVSAARVYMTSAFVKLAGPGAVFLEKGPAGWRVSAAGCVPTAPDEPYRCELEG
jgi:hypothetical protein